MIRPRASNILLIAILSGIGAGALLGGFFPEAGKSVKFLGDLFLKVLLILVIPQVMASLIVGVSSLGDVRRLGPLGARTLVYFLGTTAVAVLLGLILVVIIQPGVTNESGTPASASHSMDETIPAEITGRPETLGQLLKQVLLSLVPDNLFAAMAETQVLPLILFSLVFGTALTTVGERGRLVIQFFEGVSSAVMAIILVLIWAAPVGIGALIAGRLGEAGGFEGFWPELAALGAYAGTVILALLIHGLVVLPLLLLYVGRRKVWSYARNMGTSLGTAFSTSSSAAALPMTMECVAQENKVSQRIAGFVLPLGTTINMNGTALYEAIAAVFIAQRYGIELDPGQLVIVFITATLAAIGAAGIPEAGLVTMIVVLKAVDLPLEGISLILAIDWFLDRCRTTVNVWGDAVGAAIIHRLEGEPFQAGDHVEATPDK